MKILLTGFIRPTDLSKYFDENITQSLLSASKSLNPGVPLSDLVADLVDLGHDVTVLTSNMNLRKTLFLNGKNLNLVVLPKIKSSRIRSAIFNIPEIIRSVRFIKSEEFDVIHCHWANEISLSALLVDRNAIVTFHDNPWRIFSRYRRISNFVRLIHFVLVLVLSRNRVVVSQSLGLEFPFKIMKDSLICIPNSTKIKTLLTDSIYPHEEKFGKKFLMVSGKEKYKNREVLLESMSLLSNIDPVEIVIVSSGDSRHEEIISNKLKLKFTGELSRSQMAMVISQAYCVIHLSQIESFSLITAEARTLGVPLIVGKQCAAVIYTAGQRALQVNGNSKIEVAEAISKIANDPVLYGDLINPIFSGPEDIFSNELLLETYVSLYRRISV